MWISKLHVKHCQCPESNRSNWFKVPIVAPFSCTSQLQLWNIPVCCSLVKWNFYTLFFIHLPFIFASIISAFMSVQVSVSMRRSIKQEAKLLPPDSVLKLVASAEAMTTEECRLLPVGLFSVHLLTQLRVWPFPLSSWTWYASFRRSTDITRKLGTPV